MQIHLHPLVITIDYNSVPVGLGVSLRVLSCSLLFPVNSPAPRHQEKERRGWGELRAAGKRAVCGPRARGVRPADPAAPRVQRPLLALFKGGSQVSSSAWRSLRRVSEHLRLSTNSPGSLQTRVQEESGPA